jgi:hypothetical protein
MRASYRRATHGFSIVPHPLQLPLTHSMSLCVAQGYGLVMCTYIWEVSCASAWICCINAAKPTDRAWRPVTAVLWVMLFPAAP